MMKRPLEPGHRVALFSSRGSHAERRTDSRVPREPRTHAESTNHSQPDRITLDQLLANLSDSTRWSILVRLGEDNPRDTDEFTSPDVDEDDEDFELFAAEVTYEHLPELDRDGFIDWDRESDTITRGPNFEDVRPLITLIQNHQDELPDDWLQHDS